MICCSISLVFISTMSANLHLAAATRKQGNEVIHCIIGMLYQLAELEPC